MADAARLTLLVRGRVQGVGFRYWISRRAGLLGLAGSATNLPDGRVEVVAEGSRESIAALVEAILDGPTPGAVLDLTESWSEPRGDSGFRVR